MSGPSRAQGRRAAERLLLGPLVSLLVLAVDRRLQRTLARRRAALSGQEAASGRSRRRRGR